MVYQKSWSAASSKDQYPLTKGLQGHLIRQLATAPITLKLNRSGRALARCVEGYL